MLMSDSRLFCFGLGFSGLAVARKLMVGGWPVGGTCRGSDKANALREEGVDARVFTGGRPMEGAQAALSGTTQLLVSIAPGKQGDPALLHHEDDFAMLAGSLQRIIYFSTTAVYGDHGGKWIDEDTPVNPQSQRAGRRVKAEEAWSSFAARLSVPLDILRLSGIYGQGRNQIEKLSAGKARRIVKPGHVFNRIHVDDIARVVEALMKANVPGAIYNLADDEPAPPQDVVLYAAGLAGIEPPAEESFDDAEMTEMARSFYGESKRVANARVKQQLAIQLNFPTYREGLSAITALEQAPDEAG